jgi:hypothetical protein
MSFDLKGALLAAAEEAGKMQKDFEDKIYGLTQHINYVDSENERLKNKLNKAAAVIRQFADLLAED